MSFPLRAIVTCDLFISFLWECKVHNDTHLPSIVCSLCVHVILSKCRSYLSTSQRCTNALALAQFRALDRARVHTSIHIIISHGDGARSSAHFGAHRETDCSVIDELFPVVMEEILEVAPSISHQRIH